MFRERGSSRYNGEFTDEVGYFFITEKPASPTGGTQYGCH